MSTLSALAGPAPAAGRQEGGRAAVAGPPPGGPDSRARLAAVLDRLGDPHRRYPSVHVTGTNGKTSTARMAAALLGRCGTRVGVFTSPHVRAETERVVLDGAEVSGEQLREALALAHRAAAGVGLALGYFEAATAAAFLLFAAAGVDLAVVEVGIGGRRDATNVLASEVAVVTMVGLDHLDRLGGTVEAVAREKAGIVKPGSQLVLGALPAELAAEFTARRPRRSVALGRHFGLRRDTALPGGRQLDLYTERAVYPGVRLGLHGAHQAGNAAVALAAAELAHGAALPAPVVRAALADPGLPGRMQVLGTDPLVLLDGAKNPAGMAAAVTCVLESFAAPGGVVAVVGLLAEQDPVRMLSALLPLGASEVLVCTPPSPRARPAAQVCATARALGLPAYCLPEPAAALAAARGAARARSDRVVLVAGSLYLAAALQPDLAAGRPAQPTAQPTAQPSAQPALALPAGGRNAAVDDPDALEAPRW